MRSLDMCNIELAQHQGACSALQAVCIASLQITTAKEDIVLQAMLTSAPPAAELCTSVTGQWVTRFGGNAAAAALRVSLVKALAPSARSSSKELGALRPFWGVNITSCIQLAALGLVSMMCVA